jgi:uncharacterized protein (UPF0333 family)
MSKLADVSEAIIVSLAVIVVTVVIGGFFYYTLVYNNQQNIKRDEFFAAHCKVVNNQADVIGTSYQCGAAK